MGEKVMKGKVIMRKVLSCLVVIAILMSVFSVAVIATDSANSTASNVTLDLNDEANSSVESVALSNNITGLTCRDDLIQININKTETVVNESVNSDLSDASNTSSPDIINESDEVPDPDLPVINDTDVDTAKTVSSMSSCSYVWIKVTDKYCYGYKVYVDGVYQFTEGESGTPDGYCCFKVTPGYHTFKLTLNGKEVSKGWNCQCGHVYNWVSMNNMIPHWCERPDQCKNPPTVSFDKSKYYEGDTVHATISTIYGVYYKIMDCSGTVRDSGYASNGDTIYYTIPLGASECCYWKICFYWDEGTPPLGLAGYEGDITTASYECTKCYSFYVCPHETPCKVWVSVEDKYCKGYGVYVDGVYQFTEGESGTPDGYCRFHVTPGTHKFELRKNGCSVSKSWYCQCGTSYRWISMNDMYPHWCDCNKKKPDLVVQDIWWSPSNPKLGDTVTINVKTKNQGSENAGGFYVCYYVDGSYYTRDYVSSLSAGSTTTTSFSWTADCGSHSIKAVADCYSDVAESNEGNNARTEYINIVCKPDLITQDIYWSPSNPKEGDTVTFSVKTKNQGSESAGGFYICYYVDGSYYDRDYVSSLSAGSTTTTSFSWDADCGSHSIRAVADCYSDVAESNEGNNARTEYINIPCKPDLVVQDIYWSPANPKQGDTVTVNVKTKNQGSESVGEFYVCYYVDGSYYARDYVSSLSAGSTTTTSFTWTADCGSHSIKAVADCYDAVAENNEGNNARTESINIVCKPDLITQDISWSPSNPKQGDTVTINVKTKNQGSESVGGFYVCYYVDGSYYDRDYVSSLSAGSTTTTSFSWTADCGSHAIKAVADCYDAVAESDEENNWRSKGGLYIPCKPDLIVQDISWDKGSPKRGDTITFYVKVKNQGSGSAGTSTVKYYIDGSYVGSDTVPSLSVGSTSTQTFTWKANKCGNITVAAVADTSYAVDESNEGNNRRVETVHIECPPKEKPDLIISDISMNPSNPKVGDKVTFTATVKNIGKGIAKESYIDFSCTNINAGNMLFLKEHLCPSLKPEEIYSCYENKEIKNYGKYKIGTYADNRLAVDESNESNNVKYMYFTVPCVSKKPDLTISDISMDPSNPKQGDNVEFAVTVKNIGKETAGKSHAFIVGINRGANKELFRIEDSCPSLKPGEIYTYYKNAKMENCGEYQLMAWADAGGEVNESNENNNYRVASFKIPCEKPKITISRGLNDYKPLEVFTRGSKIQVKLENADNGEHIFSYLVWVDFNSDLTINKEDQWVSKYSFTSNKQEFDCEIPKDCPIGLYKLQVEIGGKKYISNNFFVIFDPDTGLSLQEIKNYWKDEETGNRKEGLLPYPPKFETSHHSEEVMTCMASAASIYEQFPRDKETAMKAFQYWIHYHTLKKAELVPESIIKKLVLKIKSGEKAPGDCDVFSAFLVSLARASGIPARTISGSSIGYGWHHSWVEAYYGGAWQVWDPTWRVEFGTNYPGFIDYHKKEGDLGELARVNDELGVDRTSDYTTKKEKPDLIISDISMSPSSPKQGDDVKFTVTVKNIGKGAAKKSTSLIYLINGDKQTLLFLYFPSCPPLGPGVTHTYTKNAKIEDCGKYSFKAFVDVSKEVDESNEENNRRVTSFTVPCPKEEETLVVNVYSIDGKPATKVKGTTTIELIKSGDVSPTAKQNINDKSRVAFTDIPAGNYYINVYHNPQLEQGSKEFWGQRKDISITAGTTTTIDYYRYNPYVDKFYAEKNSVEAKTPVKINVGIKVPSNCPDAEAYVKALVIIRDESGHEVYRGVSNDREVQKGGSTTFSFLYTPTEEGTYYGLAKAYVVGGGELCTDNCGWMKVFTCQNEEPDITPPKVTLISPDWDPVDWAADSKQTIKWQASDDKGVVSIDIYWINQDMPNLPILIVKGEKNDGEYLWNIPDTMEGYFKIKVVAFDADGNSGEAVSNLWTKIYKGFKSDFQIERDGYSFPQKDIGEVCYGMSSTCVRYFNYRHGYTPAEEPPEPSKSTYELEKTPEVVKRIEDRQRADMSWWDSKELKYGIGVNQAEECEKIKHKLTFGMPDIIAMALYNRSSKEVEYHAVVVWDMHKVKDDIMIYVYEPNNPWAVDNFIAFNKATHSLYYSYYTDKRLDRFIELGA